MTRKLRSFDANFERLHQDGVCGYRELENWVRTFQAIKDVRRAAQVAVISKATMDPEEQEHLMKTYVEPYC